MASLISLPLSFLRRISRKRIRGFARGIVARSLLATRQAQSAQDNEKNVRTVCTSRQSLSPTRRLGILGHLAILATGCLAMQGVFAHSSSSLTDHHDSGEATKSQPYGFDDAAPSMDDNAGYGYIARAKGTVIKDYWNDSDRESIYAKDAKITQSASTGRFGLRLLGWNTAKIVTRCEWDSATTSGDKKKSAITRFYVSSPYSNGNKSVGAQFDWDADSGDDGEFKGIFALNSIDEMDLVFRLDPGHDWEEDDKIVLRCYRKDVPGLDDLPQWTAALMVQVGERLSVTAAPSVTHRTEYAQNADSDKDFGSEFVIQYPGNDSRGIGIGDGGWKEVTNSQHQSTLHTKGLSGFSVVDTQEGSNATIEYHKNSPPGLYSIHTAFFDHNRGAVSGATVHTVSNPQQHGGVTVRDTNSKVGGEDHPAIESSTVYSSFVTIDLHPSNHSPVFRTAPADRSDSDFDDEDTWPQLTLQPVKVANVEGALVNSTKKGIYVEGIQYEQGDYGNGSYRKRSNTVDVANNHVNIARCTVRGSKLKHRDIKGFFISDDRATGAVQRGSYFTKGSTTGMELGGEFKIATTTGVAKHASGNNTDLIFRLEDDHTFRNGDKIKVWCFDGDGYQARIAVEFNITVREFMVKAIGDLSLEGVIHHDFSQYVETNGLGSDVVIATSPPLPSCGEHDNLQVMIDETNKGLLTGRCPDGFDDHNLSVTFSPQVKSAVVGATTSSNNTNDNYGHNSDTDSGTAVSNSTDTPAVADTAFSRTISLSIDETRVGTGDGTLIDNNIYLKTVTYDPANTAATTFPTHQFCDIVNERAAWVRHFYLANKRHTATDPKRGVLYVRDDSLTGNNANRFIPVSSQDGNTEDPVWGMNTTATEMVIRLREGHRYDITEPTIIQCASGDLTDESPSDVSEYFSIELKSLALANPISAEDRRQNAYERRSYNYTIGALATDKSGQNGAFFSFSNVNSNANGTSLTNLEHELRNGTVSLATTEPFTAADIGEYEITLVYKDDQTICVDSNDEVVNCMTSGEWTSGAIAQSPVHGATVSANGKQQNASFTYATDTNPTTQRVGAGDHPAQNEGVLKAEFVLVVNDFATGEQATLCTDDSGTRIFDQRVVNRPIYAREVFRNGRSGGSVIVPPTHSPPKFILTSRSKIIGLSRGEISLNLNGATFHEAMNLDHVEAKNIAGESQKSVDIALKSGGSVGSDFVVYSLEIESAEADGEGYMDKGDFLEFTLPPLANVSLLRDSDTVTIDASATAITGNFPGGIGTVSKCLTDRHSGGKACVYARSISIADLSLGPVKSDGSQNNLIGAIDPDDPTRFVGGGPVVNITAPAGLVGNATSQIITALRIGEVMYEYKFADPIANPVTRTNPHACLPSARVDHRVEPIGIRGEIMGFRRGDALNIAISPEPQESKGFLAMRHLSRGTSIVRMPSGGVFSRELSQTVLADGRWEFFFIPRSGVNLQYSDAWTLSAGLDFLHPDFTDIVSTPLSRTVIIGHQRSGRAQALAYAIPPLDSADGSFIRVRCESPDTTNTCRISLECSNQSGDESWFGHSSEPIPYHGTVVLSGQDIADILEPAGFDPESHWGGSYNGRLACQVFVRENSTISLQMLVRSSGILTNNTDINHRMQ